MGTTMDEVPNYGIKYLIFRASIQTNHDLWYLHIPFVAIPTGQPVSLNTSGGHTQAFGAAALTTFKLHISVVHMAPQARDQGPTACAMEFWVERLVQLLKRNVKYRSTSYPELLFFNRELVTLALNRQRAQYPGACRRPEELLHPHKKTVDTEHSGGVRLTGQASRLDGEDFLVFVRELQVGLCMMLTTSKWATTPFLHEA